MTGKKKVSIIELPIKTFIGTNPEDGAVAFIGSLPMVFKGRSPLAAKRAAEEWRSKEVAKADRAKENTAKRVEALKAKKEGAA